MEIVCHIGASNADGDRVLPTLLQNAEPLRKAGVLVPGQGRYRKILRNAISEVADAADGAAVASAVRDEFLLQILDGQDVRRLVMSSSTLLAMPAWVFVNGVFYSGAGQRIAALTRMFPDDEVEVFLALSNPATFIPAVWRMSGLGWDAFLRGVDPLSVRWSELITRIRKASPRARLRVWCTEDTPFVWGTLLRRLAGVGSDMAMTGEYDLLGDLITPVGKERFLSYIRTCPGQTDLQMRQVIGAFLERYATPEASIEEVEAPGWDARLVDAMTQAYDEDAARIAQIPGVEFLAP
jgi:hypothetical protein